MSAQREPAIIRRHPAADLPSRPTTSPRRVEPEVRAEPAASVPDAALNPGRGSEENDDPRSSVSNEVTPEATFRPSVGATAEKFTEQHNVRIRPSTKLRLNRAVDKLRYETGDRSISIASLTDAALCEYLDRRGI
ncbi:hypothetical protein CH299_28080 [Rhodococcus sp. 14-2686-1-2]|nr:hypothetical protein CH301_27560 [Rhodococcus sp. 15-1189-1-1a]OZF08324.1 hypothetical protein CH299_28080 [Rhodococcus sp. 14-2686-1-2]